MTSSTNINTIVKMFACVAFVFSLVMLPPSSSHSDHAAMTQSGHAMMDHASMGHGQTDVDLSNAGDEQSTDNVQADASSFGCCNGICVSVALMEDKTVCALQPVTASFALVQTQARSVLKSGALRPPRTTV
jgi:hypothetical protein